MRYALTRTAAAGLAVALATTALVEDAEARCWPGYRAMAASGCICEGPAGLIQPGAFGSGGPYAPGYFGAIGGPATIYRQPLPANSGMVIGQRDPDHYFRKWFETR